MPSMNKHYRAPQDVAFRLNVSPSTLRRWSDEFAEFLSEEASSLSGKAYRRYTDQDIERLLTAKDHIDGGLSYEQVRQKFREQLEIPAPTGLISNEDAANTIVGYISETVENVRQGQMSVLNSQAANRELMGVVIQDNFNLKEENNRLRARMLELERQMGELRREEMSRRESMRQEFEMKLMEVREMVHSTVSRNQASLQDRPGCWASLFGQRPPPSQAAPPYASHSSGPARSYPPRPPGPPE